MPERASFLWGTAMLVASNADDHIRTAANEMKKALGPRVQLCDGTADEVNMLAALNAMPTQASGGLRGGKLELSEGDFNFDALLTIPSTTDELIIEGCGRTTRLNVRGATDGITWVGDAQTLTFRNLRLVGTATAGHGFVVPATGGWLSLQNVYVNGFTQSGKYGFYADNALHGIAIDPDCWFASNANGLYLKSVIYEVDVAGHFFRNLARQATIINCSGWLKGFYTSIPTGDGSTDALVYLLDCQGLVFAPGAVDGWPAGGLNLNMVEVGKSTATYGCVGVVLLGGKYEYLAGYAGTGVPIHISVAADGIKIDGQAFWCRNASNSPIKIESDADQRVRHIRVGAIEWDTVKPPFTADSNVQDVAWEGCVSRDYAFALDNLAAGQTNAAVPLPGVTSTTYWQGKRAWAVQLEVRCSAAIPVGESLTIAVRSAAATMMSAALAAGDQNKTVSQNPFGGNWGIDTLTCVYTSSNNGAWAATLDVAVVIRIVENQTVVAIVP